MRHARADYDAIQDPRGLIPEDEPVMLFRAQDKYASTALRVYATTVEADPCSTREARDVAMVVKGWADEMDIYAGTHISKSPDL